jgi:hypothetical protein
MRDHDARVSMDGVGREGVGGEGDSGDEDSGDGEWAPMGVLIPWSMRTCVSVTAIGSCDLIRM